MREAEPTADELFAASRERAARFEPLTVGCLTDYYTFDGEFAVIYSEYNMLNALRRAAGGQPWTAFDIVENSPTCWFAMHRKHGTVIYVRLLSDLPPTNPDTTA